MVHHQIGLDIVVDQVIFPRILSTISESKEVPDVLWCSSMWKMMRFSNVIILQENMSTFQLLVIVKGGQFHTMITMIDIYKQWESYSMTMYT